MRLRRLQCLEVEVSGWNPLPLTLTAFRSLFRELRMYCPSVTKTIFVHDYERTVVLYDTRRNVYELDEENSSDTLWRET